MNDKQRNSTGYVLAEYAALEYILLGDLRDLLEEPADEQTRKWLSAVLDALLDTLPREFTLEEQDGYMVDVLEQNPNWSDEVDRLRQEHGYLFAKLKELRQRVSEDAPYAEIADELRGGLRDWMTLLIAHNRHENRLIQTSANLEIGTGD
jgi:hypothetical protein